MNDESAIHLDIRSHMGKIQRRLCAGLRNREQRVTLVGQQATLIGQPHFSLLIS
jgi:hypothetical protein